MKKQTKKQLEELWKVLAFPVGVFIGIGVAIIVTWIYKGASCIA